MSLLLFISFCWAGLHVPDEMRRQKMMKAGHALLMMLMHNQSNSIHKDATPDQHSPVSWK